MIEFDIAIIGAGMGGASLAWWLRAKAPALKVALIEAEDQAGYHTTGRSAAFWAESYGGPGVAPLTKASLPFLAAPPPGFAERPLLGPRGALYLQPPGEPAALDAVAELLEGCGVEWRRLAADELATRYPMLKPDWRQAAIIEPGCLDMDVAALHQGFLRGSQLIRSARLTAAARTAGRWRLTTTAGELTATTLVNAAGAWADEVATIAGAPPLGLMPLRRSMAVLRLDTAPPADLPVTMDAHETFYFKPDGERLWLSPADETPDMPRDVRPDEMDLATVIDRFEGVWAGQVRRLEHSWAGLRTFAPDRLPVYGWDAHVDGLFWCAGQGGFGIQTAPAAGEMAAALLLGEMPAVAAEAYGPGRFG